MTRRRQKGAASTRDKAASTADRSPDERYVRVLQMVIDLATDNILVTDIDGVFLFVGSAFAAAFDLDQEGLIGSRPVDAGIPAEVAQRLETDWHRVISYGEPSCASFRFDVSDGRDGTVSREFEYSSIPVRDDHGIVEAVITTLQDVRERRKIEENLRESEMRFRALAETLPQLVWIAGPRGDLEYANRRWCDYMGLPISRVLQGEWYSLVPDPDRYRVEHAWREAVRSVQSFETEIRLQSAAGKYRWFLARGEPVKDSKGKLIQWFGTCTDIDGQKRRLQEQSFFADLSDRMRTTLDPEVVLWEAISAIGEYLEVSRCNYADINDDKGVVTIHRDYCRDVVSHAGSYPLGSFGAGIVEDLRRGHTVISTDTQVDVRTRRSFSKTYEPLQILAFVAVPLVQNGKWSGVLTIHQSEPRVWEPDEVALLESVAERTWLAWDNVSLMRESIDAEVRQRLFVRDILASVTEGKLVLCHSPEELPQPLFDGGESIDISATDGLSGIRNLARDYARRLHFDLGRTYDLVTAVGEASMNAVVHAGGGIGRIYTNGVDRIQVWIIDQGRGIDVAALPRSTLKFGYTTAGSLGHGMKMMLQTADCIYLMTNPHGTTVVIEHGRIPPEPTIGK
jgi:PAS domain S-box-containing protein